MADLDTILETLRRQREDLDRLLEETASRSGQAAELVERIEDLRQRADETQRRFPTARVAESQGLKVSKS